jgi:hypothetical protein
VVLLLLSLLGLQFVQSGDVGQQLVVAHLGQSEALAFDFLLREGLVLCVNGDK